MKKTEVRRFSIIGDKMEITTREVAVVPNTEPEETEIKPPKAVKET